MNKKHIRRALEATASTAVILWAIGTAHGQALPVGGVALATAAPEAQAAAAAQSVPARTDPEASEIIVSARKRQESLLKVPVIATVISEQKLDNLQTTAITDLPNLVPGLMLGKSLLAIGTLIAIRGVGTSSQDSGVDQSVSLNIDGLSLSQAVAFSSGMFDLSRIEVLKGPQALFYGKSSPGGVISLRTADPTEKFELIAREGYDFEADENRNELIVSGPLSRTLKARIAGMYSTAKGYFRNNAVAVASTGALNPYRREANSENYMLRGTVLWNPSSAFGARLKANLVHDYSVNAETAQLKNCPDGPGQTVPPLNIPFTGGDDCKLDRNTTVVFLNPANFPGIEHDGVPYLQIDQRYGSLEATYHPSSSLTVTSTTGYYHLQAASLVNPTHTTAAAPANSSTNFLKRNEFTEEVRADTDFQYPLNVTLGAFYESGHVANHVINHGNTAFPTQPQGTFRNAVTSIDIKTFSLFGQARWKLVPQLELAAGARWTDETRSENVFNLITGTATTVAVPRLHATNIAPEITLTYTPTDDLTLFGAYKQGFKSGSFSLQTPPATGGNNSFGDEKVKGVEVGIKSRLFDRQLLLNVAAYDYRYKGLQVGAVEPQGAISVLRTVNAGSARAYGVDLDAAYRPQSLPGLEMNASVNWNHGRYGVLNNVPCYGGQTILEGCNQLRNPGTGLFTAQDLSGTPLIRAPEWQATFGFNYTFPIGSGLRMTVTNSNVYSSKFITFLSVGRPDNDSYQGAYIKYDLSVSLKGPDDRWEVALIGKDINNKITAGQCSASNFANSTLGGQITGGTGRGPAGVSEVGCNTERGRSVWVRVTLRPFG